MNESILIYRELLQEQLCLPQSETQSYLQRFDHFLKFFLDEIPEPTLCDLIQAFGPAEHMAQVLFRS
jgi:hypothetical protein